MLRKFTRSEGEVEVLSPEAHRAVSSELERLGKTSAAELSEDELENLHEVIDNAE